MALRLAILVSCAVVARACLYYDNPGLVRNFWDDSAFGTLVVGSPIRQTDSTPTAGGKFGVTFTNGIDIHRADTQYKDMTVCDNGVIVFGSTTATCPTPTAVAALGPTSTDAVIVADVLAVGSGAITAYYVDVYHGVRTAQYDASNKAIGPSSCDLNIVGGILNDCEEKSRKDEIVDEVLVATWRTMHDAAGTLKNYTFQAIVAVTNSSKTFVAFLYEDEIPTIEDNQNKKVVGKVFAKNSGLPGTGIVRFSEICNSTTETDIHLKSNCRCGQKGHYVFETTETTTGTHGYCGNEPMKNTCDNQDYTKADSMTINKNCRGPRKPQNTCDASSYCQINPATGNWFVWFKNFDADRATFLNYSAFVGGNAVPHGVGLSTIGSSFCTKTIMPSNDTWMNFTGSYADLSNPNNCLIYDSASQTFSYALALYNANDTLNVQYDGYRIQFGKCYLGDLPQFLNVTHNVKDIASSTVATRADRSLKFYFSSQSVRSSEENFSPATEVILGRWIFPRLCYTRGTKYEANADPYGIYVFSCQISNNVDFIQDTGANQQKFTISVIDSDGCPDSSVIGKAGKQQHAFRSDSTSDTTAPTFCAVSGGFKAFRWITESKSIWMKCLVKTCTNTQLYPYSKCKDSCANQITNSNSTDDDDVRKKRELVDDVEAEEIVAEIEIKDDEQSAASSKECADPVMAKTVIGALVALLVLATIVAVILFWKLQNRNK